MHIIMESYHMTHETNKNQCNEDKHFQRKTGPEVIKPFSCLNQLSMKF